MTKLTALDLMVISDTLYRTLSITGFGGTLGGYTKEARENVANKVQTILNDISVEVSVSGAEGTEND